MGTDNLFHRRKAKKPTQLKRHPAQRLPREKVLIVCEGQKTEPNYFCGLRDHYKLNSTYVEISGECGSDPISILKFAKRRYLEEKQMGDAFDRVYCVFDKDSHSTYHQALSAILNATPKNTFFAISSVPCFEYWLLLHFIPTTKPYSTCDAVLAQLTQPQRMPNYTKGSRHVFRDLINQLAAAISNANRALQAAQTSGTDNPTTHVHELVSYLQSI